MVTCLSLKCCVRSDEALSDFLLTLVTHYVLLHPFTLIRLGLGTYGRFLMDDIKLGLVFFLSTLIVSVFQLICVDWAFPLVIDMYYIKASICLPFWMYCLVLSLSVYSLSPALSLSTLCGVFCVIPLSLLSISVPWLSWRH